MLTDEAARRCLLECGTGGPIPKEFNEYGLSLSEWQQLGAISTTRLNLYAHLLLDKRIAKLPSVLPWTWFLLGESRKRLIARYCREHLPRTIRKFSEAETFCNFLIEHRNSIDPPYAPDVARYEIMLAAFQHRPYSPPLPGIEWEQESVSCAQTENGALIEFDYDLERILPFLQRSERPPEPFRAKTIVLFCCHPQGGAPFTYVLSDSVTRLLRLCDGRRSLSQIVTGSVAGQVRAGFANREELEQACVSILRKFLEEGIIELRTILSQ